MSFSIINNKPRSTENGDDDVRDYNKTRVAHVHIATLLSLERRQWRFLEQPIHMYSQVRIKGRCLYFAMDYCIKETIIIDVRHLVRHVLGYWSQMVPVFVIEIGSGPQHCGTSATRRVFRLILSDWSNISLGASRGLEFAVFLNQAFATVSLTGTLRSLQMLREV